MSFRSSGIAFNAELVRRANAARSKRGTLFFDSQKRLVGVLFHNRLTDRDAYSVNVDGGGAGAAGGRILPATRIYERYPWLAEILKRPAIERRFVAEHDQAEGLWFVRVGQG